MVEKLTNHLLVKHKCSKQQFFYIFFMLGEIQAWYFKIIICWQTRKLKYQILFGFSKKQQQHQVLGKALQLQGVF